MGTTGIQCPIKLESGRLEGRVRLHTEKCSTKSGKAIFVKGDWNNVKAFQDELAPKGDELWVAYMTVQVPLGVTASYFNFNQGALETAVNRVVPGVTEPFNIRYRFKLGKGRVTNLWC